MSGRINKNWENQIVIMDFSGVYREEVFWQGQQAVWVDARDIAGTNCYCDDEAAAEILSRTEKFGPEGIHFIDSGNYHYMSRLWLGKISGPFRLLVFDNHTDMQLPAFGGLLSCGGWIGASLVELDDLKEVILIGPDQDAYDQVEDEFKKKVHFLSREKLFETTEEEICRFLRSRLEKDALPLYISIDKDVLAPGQADTTWSQGDMLLEELLFWLEQTAICVKNSSGRLIGVDICGECDVQTGGNHAVNDAANERLLQFLTGGYERDKL